MASRRNHIFAEMGDIILARTDIDTHSHYCVMLNNRVATGNGSGVDQANAFWHDHLINFRQTTELRSWLTGAATKADYLASFEEVILPEITKRNLL